MTEGLDRQTHDSPHASTYDSQTIKSYLQSLRALVDARLEERARFSPDCPKRLADAMRYSLLAPGKRLRPQFALLASSLCGGEQSEALAACVALESVHAYSLIHDDLPAMDDDDLRRGRPTCHRQFDEATAILAGDALLTFAFEVLSTDLSSREVAAQCVLALSQAAGAQGMVGGQTDDVVWGSTLKSGIGAFDLIGETLATAAAEGASGGAGALDSRQAGLAAFLRKIHRRKTGALIVAALKLGALTANASARQLEILEAYGRYWGQAFQISDDLLDVVGDETSMGKRVHKDEEAGKLTYPSLYGIDRTRELLDETSSNAKRALLESGDAFDHDSLAFQTLLYLVDYVVRREQ